MAWGFCICPLDRSRSYSPVATGNFVSPVVDPLQGPQSLANLDAAHAAGVTFAELHDLQIYSPDRPGGTSNPIKPGRVTGWLRVGVTGVDGSVSSASGLPIDKYGNTQRPGYVGAKPFEALISFNEKQRTVAEFVTSAVSESHIDGYLYIPPPADIARLRFVDLKLTSTAHLVGGNVVLPPGGVRLTHWDLQLVPTGPPDQAGVLSVRTGRVLFLAAGIAEPVHFARPFGLTWGELLASGNLGELFLDYNDWGQRFDGQVFHPDAFQLSPFPGTGNPQLAVSGAIVFRYFGVAYVNLTDAALVGTGSSPFPRWVEAPKAAVTPSSRPTRPASTRRVARLEHHPPGTVRLPRRQGGLQQGLAERLPRDRRSGIGLPAFARPRHHRRDPGGGDRHPDHGGDDPRLRAQRAAPASAH